MAWSIFQSKQRRILRAIQLSRSCQIAVGDTISIHIVNVPPQTAETPDCNDDLERNAFEAAKAKYLELKSKYEP
jgi:hypothetical protein